MATDVVKQQTPISDLVFNKVKNFQELGQLTLPKDYNVGNSLKAAQLMLTEMTNSAGKPVLESCTQASIANSLLKMVTQGLEPLKHQCAFIVRGNKLCCDVEYAGKTMIAKRDAGLKNVKAYTYYKGDNLKYTVDLATGLMKIISYDPSIENIKIANIEGAFAIAVFEDGSTDACVMSYDQIKQSWKQGPSKGNSPAHNNFPDQMCEKTVINRCLKRYISSSIGVFDEQDETHESVKEPIQRQSEIEEIDVAVEVAETIQEAEIVSEAQETTDPF